MLLLWLRTEQYDSSLNSLRATQKAGPSREAACSWELHGSATGVSPAAWLSGSGQNAPSLTASQICCRLAATELPKAPEDLRSLRTLPTLLRLLQSKALGL